MRWLAAILAAWMTFWVGSAALAQPTPDYASRTNQLIVLLKADGGEEAVFAPVFLDAVPLTQWRELTAALRRQHGGVTGLSRIIAANPFSGTVEVAYQRATVGFNLVLSPDAPHRIIGLRVTGARTRNDSIDKVMADIRALPGLTSFAIASLSTAPPAISAEIRKDSTLAVGSVFKLYILAELTRSIGAGERRWGDVFPLTRKSFSGRLAAWPDDAPMTLHSLATAMIAESDNSAADTLLHALGRDKVDLMVAASGHADAASTLPILSTTEAFALKMPGAAALQASYLAANLPGRRALLQAHADTLGAAAVDVGQIADRPVAIDRIEWFASAADLIRLLDHVRQGGGEALPILTVNPGIAPGDAARWTYLGYKGGSEPGVIAMSFLGRARDGQYHAVAGIWNNSAAPVDNARFTALMARALNLLADPPK